MGSAAGRPASAGGRPGAVESEQAPDRQPRRAQRRPRARPARPASRGGFATARPRPGQLTRLGVERQARPARGRGGSGPRSRLTPATDARPSAAAGSRAARRRRTSRRGRVRGRRRGRPLRREQRLIQGVGGLALGRAGLAEGHQVHGEWRQRPRPGDAVLVGELLDGGGRRYARGRSRRSPSRSAARSPFSSR